MLSTSVEWPVQRFPTYISGEVYKPNACAKTILPSRRTTRGRQLIVVPAVKRFNCLLRCCDTKNEGPSFYCNKEVKNPNSLGFVSHCVPSSLFLRPRDRYKYKYILVYFRSSTRLYSFFRSWKWEYIPLPFLHLRSFVFCSVVLSSEILFSADIDSRFTLQKGRYQDE
jgi:hypothetical protein